MLFFTSLLQREVHSSGKKINKIKSYRWRENIRCISSWKSSDECNLIFVEFFAFSPFYNANEKRRQRFSYLARFIFEISPLFHAAHVEIRSLIFLLNKIHS